MVNSPTGANLPDPALRGADFLKMIMAERRAAVEVQKRRVPVQKLQEAASVREHHSLIDSLYHRSGPAIIAEMKKASPSAGLLVPDYDPCRIGRIYEDAGAIGISILTEPKYFLGSDDHVRAVRAEVSLPVLRKDFVCDPYQIYESAALGADVILLIVAALDPVLMKELHRQAVQCGLEVLVESHTEEEVGRALELPGALIGVNSRNLKTLKTDLRTALNLASLIPDNRLAVAESGIKTHADIVELTAAGYDAFLIGESLLNTPDPKEKIRSLLGPG